MTRTNPLEAGDRALRAGFEAARAEGDPQVPLPEAFAARLMADADAALPAPPHPDRTLPVSAPYWAWVREAFAPLGGWRAAGGLAACAALGFWLGLAPPAALDPLRAAVTGKDTALSADDFLAPLDGADLDV